MFEKDILRGHLAETGDGLPLRQIAWSDLVARLAAVRDLRDEMERIESASGGDFGQFSQLRCQANDEGKRPVNHNALSDGKSDGATGDEKAVIDAARGDREI